MSDADLDAAYTQLCRTMTTLGEAQAPLFLARFAMLALVHIGERGIIERLVREAAADLQATPV